MGHGSCRCRHRRRHYDSAWNQKTRRSNSAKESRRLSLFCYGLRLFPSQRLHGPELVALVRELAKSRGRDSALDLFSGVGLFSLPLACQFEKVVAVESSSSACRLCTSNASTAGLRNIQVVTADVAAWMTAKGSGESSQFDLIVLDPPRSGAGPEVMEQIRKWAPATIIYVSCDPKRSAEISPEFPRAITGSITSRAWICFLRHSTSRQLCD